MSGILSHTQRRARSDQAQWETGRCLDPKQADTGALLSPSDVAESRCRTHRRVSLSLAVSPPQLAVQRAGGVDNGRGVAVRERAHAQHAPPLLLDAKDGVAHGGDLRAKAERAPQRAEHKEVSRLPLQLLPHALHGVNGAHKGVDLLVRVAHLPDATLTSPQHDDESEALHWSAETTRLMQSRQAPTSTLAHCRCPSTMAAMHGVASWCTDR